MIVVAHECIRKHAPFVRHADAEETAEEQRTKLFVEDRLLVVSTGDDVIVRAWLLMTWSPGHQEEVRGGLAKHKATSHLFSTLVSVLSLCLAPGMSVPAAARFGG